MSVLKVSIQVDPENTLKTQLKIDTGPKETGFPFESLTLEAKPPATEAYRFEVKLKELDPKAGSATKSTRGLWRKLCFWAR